VDDIGIKNEIWCLPAHIGRVNVLVRAFLSRHFGHTYTYANREDKWMLRDPRIKVWPVKEGKKEKRTKMRTHCWNHSNGVMPGSRSSDSRHNILSRHINSKIAIVREQYFFFCDYHVLLTIIQLLRIYCWHKLHAPFIWSS